MKIFLTAALISISFTTMASNWMPVSKIESKSSQAYQLESECKKSGEQCLDIGDEPLVVTKGFFTLSEVTEDDLSEPLWGSRSMIESCDGEDDCKIKAVEKNCADEREAFYNADYSETWCNKIVGYMQKSTGVKSILIDLQALVAYKTAANLKAIFAAQRSYVSKLRECLAGVIDLLVLRNSSKLLSTAQVEQMVQTYQPIMALLQAVSGVTAKEKILAVSADGVLITEGDKVALTQEIDKCLGN